MAANEPASAAERVRAEPPDPADTGADASPGYEQARAELAEVVRRLESGGIGLEESLRLWERGEHLVEVCQRWLDGARDRLAQATRPSD